LIIIYKYTFAGALHIAIIINHITLDQCCSASMLQEGAGDHIKTKN